VRSTSCNLILTPLAAFILEITEERSWTRGEVARRLGYTRPERGLRRLDAFLGGALPDKVQASLLAKALQVTDSELAKVIEAARAYLAILKRGETEARERAARDCFIPHAWALTRRQIPSPIFAVAVFGEAHFLRVDLPRQIGALPQNQAMRLVREHCRTHFARWRGRAGPFGEIRGYSFRKTPTEASAFSPDGSLLHHDEQQSRTFPRATLTLTTGRSLRPLLPAANNQSTAR
jgi:hypothetical protein